MSRRCSTGLGGASASANLVGGKCRYEERFDARFIAFMWESMGGPLMALLLLAKLK